ncbi:Bug family tripartite tricarboxylate transporter substrate binding protein [Bradyrhizobium sp. cf659]|uniref:Bug family tripartite tricarboxylate transporter substrate binding protein n=1 Tax=Bradyrhizobium sp. cf659 TaxID=1761771 RepID=UPI0008E674C9|nr:tripartite tricarboxylate transporter substrate-binding protein [Bradyrhizobium sp. cf659]SFI63097.1 Tripartite tricarboxylate transporter family receptor [Bradyrhizobium sp. cf659]
MIAWLKANPDKASVGIAGVGATGHLAGIALQKETGTQFQFVPYRGNGPAMQDLVAGHIDAMIEPASNFKALVGAGRRTDGRHISRRGHTLRCRPGESQDPYRGIHP